jgi:hypothetical protein
MSKSSKSRFCPALGRAISRAECGEGRISRIPCSPDCEFNPFGLANCGQFLELEEACDGLAMDRLKKSATDVESLTRQMQRALDRGAGADLPGTKRRNQRLVACAASWLRTRNRAVRPAAARVRPAAMPIQTPTAPRSRRKAIA